MLDPIAAFPSSQQILQRARLRSVEPNCRHVLRNAIDQRDDVRLDLLTPSFRGASPLGMVS